MPGPYMLAQSLERTPENELTLAVGHDLVLAVDRVTRSMGDEWDRVSTEYVAYAADSDGNPLAELGRFPSPPDGATLTLLAGIAGVHFPDHINLRES